MLIFTYSYPYGRPMLADYYSPFWIIYSEEKFEVYKKYEELQHETPFAIADNLEEALHTVGYYYDILLKENCKLRSLICNMTHDENALEDMKPMWLPLVQEWLGNFYQCREQK